MKRSILVIDPDEILRDQLYGLLTAKGYRVYLSKTGEEGIRRCHEQPFKVVLLDVSVGSAESVLEQFLKFEPQPIVLVTATNIFLDVARKLCDRGAFDLISKPFERDTLHAKLARALSAQNIKASLITQVDVPSVIQDLPPTIVDVLSRYSRLPGSRSSILIIGERGTEKEVLARTIHKLSPRSMKPFVPFSDIAAELSGSLERKRIEKTLKTGVLGQIDGGSIFVEEVLALSPEAQTQLLQILREADRRKEGYKQSQYLDIRIFGGSEKDLEEAVIRGKFMKELFYKLTPRIPILPLRDRSEDVLFWARHFLRKLTQEHQIAVSDELIPELCAKLTSYSWPDNLPELENAIERAILLGRGPKLGVHDVSFIEGLNERVVQISPSQKDAGSVNLPIDFDEAMRQYEVGLIRRALEATNGHQSRAARFLRMNPTTLNSKMKKHRIEFSKQRTSDHHKGN
jgi:DNA-binding NtrC family response regulator